MPFIVHCNQFVPVTTKYEPIGDLYRRIAQETCVRCWCKKAEHLDSVVAPK